MIKTLFLELLTQATIKNAMIIAHCNLQLLKNMLDDSATALLLNFILNQVLNIIFFRKKFVTIV